MPRYRNLGILVTVLLIEIVVLVYQVHRNRDVPLLRQIAVLAITPIDKGIRVVSGGTWRVWRNYMDLRGARTENAELQEQLKEIKLENQRLQEDAQQGKRLQGLLQFKDETPSETIAAQVISSGANETSRVLIIDKGQAAGLRPDMAVIVPDGIVGKVLRVFPHAAQVLLLTDPNSGVACLLETSRVHGVLKGQNKSLASLGYIVNDDKVQIGQKVFTSGEDRIYPKGFPVGVVVEARPGGPFQDITVQPFAKLDRLEEVLVVTKNSDVDLPAGTIIGPQIGPSEAAISPGFSPAPSAPAPVLPPAAAKPVVPQPLTAVPSPAPKPKSQPKEPTKMPDASPAPRLPPPETTSPAADASPQNLAPGLASADAER
jgi:rod shape-determining protein MreC